MGEQRNREGIFNMIKYTTLGNVITPAKVVRCGNGVFSVLSMTMRDGIVLQSERFKKNLASLDQADYKVVKRGQLVVGFPIDEGVLYVQNAAEEGIMSPAYNVWDINTEIIDTDFLELSLHSPQSMQYYKNKLRGTTARRRSIPTSDLLALKIPLPDLQTQQETVTIIKKANKIISLRQQQLQKLDELVKSRFIELFGDLKSNPMKWPVVPFTEFAKIDGNMTTDYEKYADYPHIGIDSIEKGTGALKGYRTVKEDGVISGKYIFTPQHIIYSKIRPNLNKVALPDFEGLCSADAYPILPNHDNCNRVFLAIALRSEYFLEYILQFSSRTNLPKVNRKEIAGFCMPLPPLKLQQQFAAFVEQTDKSKLAVQKGLQELETLKKSLMQKYFG